jgi:hypothetical protein
MDMQKNKSHLPGWIASSCRWIVACFILLATSLLYADSHINLADPRLQEDPNKIPPTQSEIQQAIQNTDKAVANKATADQKAAADAQRAADQAKLAEAQQKLNQARAANTQIMQNLNSGLTNLEGQLSTAKQQQAAAEKALEDYKKAQTGITLFISSEQKALEKSVTQTKEALEQVTAQVKNQRQAIQTTTQNNANHETQLQQKMELSNSEVVARETTRRTAELLPVITDYETQLEQIKTGRAVFEAKDAMMEGVIAQAQASGNTDLVKSLQKDQQKMRDAYDAWIASMQHELAAHNKRMQQTFEQNRLDGVGATNTGELRDDFRGEANKLGMPIPPGGISFVDTDAVAATAGSSMRIATGAPGHQDANISIWTEFSVDSLKALAGEMSTDIKGLTLDEFGQRWKYYFIGLGEGTATAIKDLWGLLSGAVDLTAESLEELLNKLFNVETNVFGREQSKAFAEALAGLTNLDGETAEKALYELAKRFDRELEKTAGSGKAGERKAAQFTGNFAGQVIGGEEFILVKVISKISKARKLLTGADEVLDAASDAAKASKADCPGTTRTRAQQKAAARAAAAKSSNMAPGHAEAISNVAVQRNEVILFRPVNPHSTDLIRRNAATKSMHIKGKSSDWGPHAGLIPIDPKLSKLGGPGKNPSAATLEKYAAYNQKALDSGVAIAVPARGADGKVIKIDGEPVMVLGDPKTGNPITADYDLLAVGSKNDQGKILNDKDLGNIAEGEVDLVNDINKSVKDTGYGGGNVAHHGAANRFEKALDPAGDFPITAMTPDGNIQEIKNLDELTDFVNAWDPPYNIPIPPGWNIPKNPIAAGSKFAPLSAADQVGLINAVKAARAGFGTTTQDCPDPVLDKPSLQLSGTDGDGTVELEAVTPTDKNEKGPKTGVGDDSGGGSDGDTKVSIGGFDGTPVVDPVLFSFGGQGDLEGITTSCPSWCLDLVDQYNGLLNGTINPKPPFAQKIMDNIKNFSLPKCEEENCKEEDGSTTSASGLSLDWTGITTGLDFRGTSGSSPLPSELSTDCPPCQVYVDSYKQTQDKIKKLEGALKLLQYNQGHSWPFGDVLEPDIKDLEEKIAKAKEFLNAIKLSLTACEQQCARVLIINVLSLFGNFPYDRLNPLSDPNGNSSGTSSGQTVLVIANIPIIRLSLAGIDACPENHYHGTGNNCNGVSVSDPDSSGCGHGTVSQVIAIPVESCPDL